MVQLRHSLSCVALALAALAIVASSAHAQLRPLDPLDWRILGLEGGSLEVGGGVYSGQRASLAGTTGRLVEVGSLRVTWSFGRVAVELAGTPLWLFEEQVVVSPPEGDVVPADDAHRITSGDAQVSTVVQLTAQRPDRGLALRFGARLPTTDNRQGLDRDQTDVYALLAGRITRGPLAVGAEFGLGVNGTRDLQYEQVDPLLYLLSFRYDLGVARAVLAITGQHDPRAGEDRRGTEDLGEGRLGVEMGNRRWVSVEVVRGWTPSSPDMGLIVKVGTHF